MERIIEQKCTRCQKDIYLTSAEEVPICVECFAQMINPKPFPFYKRWYYWAREWYYIITGVYLIEKTYLKDSEHDHPNFPGERIKEVTHSEFLFLETNVYNIFGENNLRWYPKHCNKFRFLTAAIICKRLQKQNTDPYIQYSLLPYNTIPEDHE